MKEVCFVRDYGVRWELVDHSVSITHKSMVEVDDDSSFVGIGAAQLEGLIACLGNTNTDT